MTVASKFLPRLHETTVCSDVFHPWASKCSTGAAIMWWDSLLSCSKFYIVLYVLQILIKRTKDYQLLMRCFLGSILHGAFGSSIFIYSNCLMRNSLKRFHHFWIGYGCGALGGLAIFLEHPTRRNILNITFFNMVLDLVFRQLDQKGYTFLTESLRVKLSLFMVINSVLLYKLRKNPKNQGSTLWFFTPPHSAKQEGNKLKSNCHHSDPCWKNIGKCASFYFALGTAIQFGKIALYTKKLGLPKLTDMGFPLFAACYVFLYKAVTCALFRRNKKDSPYHALLGGLASGAALWFFPSRSIFLAALGNLIQILARDFKEANRLPDLPYCEISFSIFNAFLYNSRILRPETCPNFFILLINIATNNRAGLLHSSFEKRINELAGFTVT